MAIIISDMIMPSSCSYCEFGRRLDNVSTMCERHPSELPVQDDLGKRPEHCPLQEVDKDYKALYEEALQEWLTEKKQELLMSYYSSAVGKTVSSRTN